MDVLRKEEACTIEDIYALPNGERAELIDGKIYYMAPPNTKHQTLVMDLSYQIKDYINRNHGECSVFPAPFAVFLNENDKNYVEPDISVICDKNKITDPGLKLYFANSKQIEQNKYTSVSTSRLFAIEATGEDLENLRKKVYDVIEKAVDKNLDYRKDIGVIYVH